MSAWEGDAAPVVVLEGWLEASARIEFHENLRQGDSQFDLCKAIDFSLARTTCSGEASSVDHAHLLLAYADSCPRMC